MSVPARLAPAELHDDLRHLWDLAATVADPEIPVLSIADLGVLRDVGRDDGGRVVVTITPTYSGCPAMQHIEQQLTDTFTAAGVEVEVRTVFSPAWTTDWITAEGRRALTAYGIAAPHRAPASGGPGDPSPTVWVRPAVRCPRCDSLHTTLVSEFGSTACKALYRCRSCQEPFDYVKEL